MCGVQFIGPDLQRITAFTCAAFHMEIQGAPLKDDLTGAIGKGKGFDLDLSQDCSEAHTDFGHCECSPRSCARRCASVKRSVLHLVF